ncbi:MAG: hypoxanthine phosphoribosyltransferase [Halodesulfurarchaeum sp.]
MSQTYMEPPRLHGYMASSPIEVRDRPPYSLDHFDVQEAYKSDLEHILVSKGELISRIRRMAEEISKDAQRHTGSELYAACVLKGALRFFGTLTPKLNPPGDYSEGVIQASRYTGGSTRDTTADVSLPEEQAVRGKDVLIVEDIIDEGYTLKTILEAFREMEPRSVSIAVLFDKRDRRKVDIDVEYTGFVVPDEFLVGFGLDYNERYRNLDHLAALDPAILEE